MTTEAFFGGDPISEIVTEQRGRIVRDAAGVWRDGTGTIFSVHGMMWVSPMPAGGIAGTKVTSVIVDELG